MDRREDIIEAAVVLFHEKGFANTSMQDIADAVGMLKGSLYHHITSKEELLYEIHERFMNVILRQAEVRQSLPKLSSRQQLESIIADLLAAVRDYRPYVEVFFRERYAVRGPRWEAIHRKREAYEAMVRNLIREGQRDGSFRADLDSTVVTLGLFGMCNWSFQWLDPNGRLSAAEIAQTFATLFLDGLSPRS
jgi:TetR/AcrR family transcriptional regulator, cholesterol catabolism regulator